MKNKLLIIIVLITILTFVFYSTKKRESNKNSHVLGIGVSLPLTGSIAHLGQSAHKGVELAQEELHTEFPDLHVQYFEEDNAFTGKTAVNSYNKLRIAHNIDGILSASSPATLAIQPIAKQDNILQIGIFASTPKYSTPDDLSFRIFPRAEKEAEALFNYLSTEKIERAVIFYINNDYGQGLFGTMQAMFEKESRGLKIIASEGYLPGITDFRTQLLKFKSLKPQALVMLSPASDVVIILKQSKELGIQTKFLSGAAASDQKILSESSESEGLLMPDIFDPQSTNEKAKKFAEKFRQKFGEEPNLFAAQGYDGYRLMVMALQKCQRDAECLKSYLFGLKDYPTILGNLTFDRNGDPQFSYFIKVFRNRKFERLMNGG